MKLWKVVRRIDNKLKSALQKYGLEIEYVPGEPSSGKSVEEHAAAHATYYFPNYFPDYFPDYVCGLYVFTDLKHASYFQGQWGDSREVWECTGDVVERRDHGVAIAQNVILTKQVKKDPNKQTGNKKT